MGVVVDEKTRRPDDAFKPFHSSVNRIPIPREYIAKELSQYDELSGHYGDTGDSNLPTHDCLDNGKISGSVDVTITARSPIVTGEQPSSTGIDRKRSKIIQDEHRTPLFPATTIKGMLSQAYEQLTASRFRVFGDHSARLTYRADPAAAVRLLPVRVVKLTSGEYKAQKLALAHYYTFYYTIESADDGTGFTYIAQPKHNKDNQDTLTQFTHGQKVNFCFRAAEGSNTHYVTKIQKNNEWVPLRDSHGEEPDPSHPDEEKSTGYLYITTRDEDLCSEKQKLFKGGGYYHSPSEKSTGSPGKISEYIFFENHEEELSVHEDKVRDFQLVIDSYAYDSTDKAAAAVGHSRFARDTSRVPRRTEGDEFDYLSKKEFLAFAEISGRKVIGLYPTQIGRRTYSNSPETLAQTGRVAPLRSHNEAAAADRLFGYTASTGSLRGRLTIDDVKLSRKDVCEDSVELKPLLKPNPSSARRFLTGRTDFSKNDDISGAPRKTYFTETQLLGSATYPFKRPKGNGARFPSGAKKSNADNSDGNGSVTFCADSWIKPGATISFTLHFTNLTRLEFATLRWLLNSANLNHADGTNRRGFLRLGIGKPLGLGIVQVDADEESWRLYVPRDNLIDLYKELSGCFGYVEDEDLTTLDSVSQSGLIPSEEWDFTEDERKAFLSLPNVRAFRRAATGYGKKATVRYMYLCENGKNNQTDSKSGKPKPGRGLAPRLLSLDEGWDSPLEIKDN